MKSKIFFISLGCPRNLVDSEILKGILKKDFSFTENVEKAQIFIVNTCAFIDSAKQESIDTILELASFKKGASKKLIVTGCLPQRYGNELCSEIPEIDGIFGSSDFMHIPEFLKKSLDIKKTHVSKIPTFLYDHKLKRSFISPAHYAYIKLQEGCMNNCSYCVIPVLRGPYRSRDFNSIIEEAKSLKEKGVKEINLIGQDTTLYGIDKYKRVRISEVLKKLSNIMKNRWIRLLYTHPAHYSDELIDVIASEDSISKYLDIPIQHISDKILKRMNRNITKKEIVHLIKNLRKKIPNITIRTTVLVGFPGEKDKEFNELISFLKEIKFERLGAFIYSREEGTKAYSLEDQIPEKIKKDRYNKILEIQKDISEEKNKSLMGKFFKILIDEKIDRGHTHFLGRTQMDAPEVDGTCYVRSKKELPIGSFQDVRITDTLEYDLVGEII